MKVLIVDDSPEALTLAKARLRSEGLELITADCGAAGLKMARNQKPDLILLDVDMPDMSGFDVCRAMKADTDLCMIPIIFLTGSGDVQDKVEGLNLGAVDYVTKPFDKFELQARVSAALRTKHMQDLLIEHAHIDPLTEMPNRRALADRLGQEWAQVQRYGGGSLSFIMADLDHFKRVNDTFGHSIGDKVLQKVAQTIVSQCREVDLPARYGGEEFAIVVPDETAEGAMVLAERCRQAIAKAQVTVGGEDVRVTASFGVADAVDAPSVDALIAAADNALYQAKQAGRNRVMTTAPATPAIRDPNSSVLNHNIPIIAMTADAIDRNLPDADREDSSLQEGANAAPAEQSSNETFAKCPYDKPEALERAGGDEDLFGELVAIFLDEAPGALAQVHDAVSSGDPEAITRTAHALRGSLGVLAADDAVRAAQSVETLSRSGDLQGVQETVAVLAIEIQRLTTALQRETKETPACRS